MRTLLKSSFAIVLLVTVLSCKKTSTATPNENFSAAKESSVADSCGGKWVGIYASPGLPNKQVNDNTFIGGGVANLSLSKSPYSYFFSAIELKIPSCKNISADSLKFSARLKNPSNEPGAIADYDVNLYLYGSDDTAHVTFIAFRPQFTYLGLNNIRITNSSDLLFQYENWSTVSLKAANEKLTVHRDGVLISQISYAGAKIGKLKKIALFFKGPGSVDWVNLKGYNPISKLDKLIMEEDFNGTKSNVIWY